MNLEDFKEYRFKYWYKALLIFQLILAAGSLFWSVKDLLISSGSKLLISLLCRGLPALVMLLRPLVNKDNVTAFPTAQLWLNIVGIFTLYVLDDSIANSGNGWLLYYFFFFFLGITYTRTLYSALNLSLYSATIVITYHLFPEKLTVPKSDLYFTYFVLVCMIIFSTHFIQSAFREGYGLKLKLRNAVVRCALTGCYNRNILNEILIGKKVLPFAATVIMLDVDYFKKLNDNQGHDYGDKCLKDTVNILTDSVGQDNYVIRYGGDEFVAICKEPCDAGEVYSKIVEHPLFIGNSHLTYSIGSYKASKFSDFYQAIKLADTALYVSKNNGRNQITKFEDLGN